MHIVVCIKQVAARNSPLLLDTQTQWINESHTQFEFNEADHYALEEALKLKDSQQAEVTVITLGGQHCSQSLREALAKGADQAIHIDDEHSYQLEPFQIACALANAINSIEYDLVFTGLQSDDQGYSQTGIILAELLNLPHISMALEIELQDKTLKVKKELEQGQFQYIQTRMPALLTIQSGINQPRYANMKNILQAKKKPQMHLYLGDSLHTDIAASQKVLNIYFPQTKQHTEFIQGPADKAAEQLLRQLKIT